MNIINYLAIQYPFDSWVSAVDFERSTLILVDIWTSSPLYQLVWVL
jgi:hypothetical protein